MANHPLPDEPTDEEFLSLVGMKFMGRTILCWCGQGSKLMKLKSGEKAYICHSCNTKHGAHQAYPYDPLGTPAEPEVRKLRRNCHVAFDKWRALNGWKRSQTYHQLALLMGLSRESCHIGMFDRPTCEQCLALLNDKIAFLELVKGEKRA